LIYLILYIKTCLLVLDLEKIIYLKFCKKNQLKKINKLNKFNKFKFLLRLKKSVNYIHAEVFYKIELELNIFINMIKVLLIKQLNLNKMI